MLLGTARTRGHVSQLWEVLEQSSLAEMFDGP
jgi:hypothetical protein